MDEKIEWLLIEIVLGFVIVKGEWKYGLVEFLWVIIVDFLGVG